MRNLWIAAAVALVVLIALNLFIDPLSLIGASRGLDAPPDEDQTALKAGLIIGLGGFGDRSFNDLQYKGMILAQGKYGVGFSYKEPESYEDIPVMMDELLAENCDVIISGSTDLKPIIRDVAPENPDTLFVLLDEALDSYPPNAASIRFKQNEGSYLAGALAAMMSSSGVIGAIGGRDIGVIRDFLVGYEAGALRVRPDVSVELRYIENYDPDTIPWSNPATGKRIAMELQENFDADVIFGVAAASNLGIFQAAKINGSYAIGVDADQDYLAQGTILTSMMKNLDEAIVYILGEILAGRFENKSYELGLAENGVGLSPMEFTRDQIPEEYLATIDNLRQRIISGEIRVPSEYSSP